MYLRPGPWCHSDSGQRRNGWPRRNGARRGQGQDLSAAAAEERDIHVERAHPDDDVVARPGSDTMRATTVLTALGGAAVAGSAAWYVLGKRGTVTPVKVDGIPVAVGVAAAGLLVAV